MQSDVLQVVASAFQTAFEGFPVRGHGRLQQVQHFFLFGRILPSRIKMAANDTSRIRLQDLQGVSLVP